MGGSSVLSGLTLVTSQVRRQLGMTPEPGSQKGLQIVVANVGARGGSSRTWAMVSQAIIDALRTWEEMTKPHGGRAQCSK